MIASREQVQIDDAPGKGAAFPASAESVRGIGPFIGRSCHVCSVDTHIASSLGGNPCADVVCYSRLMGIDEAGTLARIKACRKEIAEPATARHGGRVVKLMGDGALIEFPSVVEAVQAAVEIQEGLAEHNAGQPEAQRVEFRIGINLGDVIEEDGDVFGDGVNTLRAWRRWRNREGSSSLGPCTPRSRASSISASSRWDRNA